MGNLGMHNKLKQLRVERGLTLREVAAEFGVTISAYSNYEQGLRQPPYDVLSKICTFFDVSADYLLGIKNFED